MNLKACPFCGCVPEVGPENPKKEGDAWAYVICTNTDCHAQPGVGDGQDVSDDRGPDAYKESAIKRWNTREEPK